ncbi:MAG TPA: transcriptional regulator [Nocardioidaceae bacterium]|nr:transcriptional regulator [Nocardioidaceae bacterium]
MRRRLYEYVVAQAGPVGREQAARGVGVPVHTAKFHLDRLAEEGLLDVEFRRLTGRTGPGAGRPAKLYRRAAGEVAVTLPERHYDLAGQILAAAVERAADTGVPVREAVHDEARSAGRCAGGPAVEPHRAAEAGQFGQHESSRLREFLDRHGYEPRAVDDPEGEGPEFVLANCPFHALVTTHTELVCGLNLAFLAGALETLDCPRMCARLDPEPGRCCVTIAPEPEPGSGSKSGGGGRLPE